MRVCVCTCVRNSCCSTWAQVITAGHASVLMFYGATNLSSFLCTQAIIFRWSVDRPGILIGSRANKLNGCYKWVIYVLTFRLRAPARLQRARLAANTSAEPMSCRWSSWRRSFNVLQVPHWSGQWRIFQRFSPRTSLCVLYAEDGDFPL